MKAYIFPGQGSQFPGMGIYLYKYYPFAIKLFNVANKILGFDITKYLVEKKYGNYLKYTRITQPAIYIYSFIAYKILNFVPDMIAGHSLGEFTAITISGVLDFETCLNLVYKRALAMETACKNIKSNMAAILGLEDNLIENTCKEVSGIVVPANYNCNGQLVISGETTAIKKTCELLKVAKKIIILPVEGAFHSPIMEPARDKLADYISKLDFKNPICPIYQNINALGTTNPLKIKENIINQLTNPVKWKQSVENMISNGANIFIEIGPRNILQSLVKKINKYVYTQNFKISL
ncbi:MAG: ACP S-malonyltransferase [Candidatus Bostrichicola ureolyticus]|nr:MAG: ACP S-malonyltransferase [Candidatus Bostrichicola ureolyticus]